MQQISILQELTTVPQGTAIDFRVPMSDYNKVEFVRQNHREIILELMRIFNSLCIEEHYEAKYNEYVFKPCGYCSACKAKANG